MFNTFFNVSWNMLFIILDIS